MQSRLYILHTACSMCHHPTYFTWDHRLPKSGARFHRYPSLWIGSTLINYTRDLGKYRISSLSCFCSNANSQISIFLHFSPSWGSWLQYLSFFMIVYVLFLFFLFLFLFSALLEFFPLGSLFTFLFLLSYSSTPSFSHFLLYSLLMWRCYFF